MFEHRSQKLLTPLQFLVRFLKSAAAAGVIIGGSLAIGILGYHWTEGLSWIDSFLNASMILTGMGPVSPLHSGLAKLFASFYALYSGIAFITTSGILLAPILHRLFHKFHMSVDNTGQG